MKKSIEYYILTFITLVAMASVSVVFWKPLAPSDYGTILIYLLLMIFINSFPLKVGEIYITFILAVSISAFLEYGMVVEIWLVQITFLVSMLILRQKRPLSRIIINQVMFFWISFVSGLLYLVVGGEISFKASSVGVQMIPIVMYAVSNFITNHVMLFIILRWIQKQKVNIFSEDTIWDAATLLLTLPLGVIMYLVKISYGTYGMMFVAIPIIITTHLFRIYNELHNSHHQLTILNKISASFTSELNIEKAISSIQNSIKELLSFDYSYIFLFNGMKLKLMSVMDAEGKEIENGKYKDFDMALGEGLSGRVALYKKAQMVGSDADIFKLSVEPDFIRDNKSLLSVPMLWNNQIMGVITLGSQNEFHFSKRDLTIAKILASQAAVAIQNGKRFQKTEEKSLIDELTGVYNFRAFADLLRDKLLEAEMKGQKLSLLMIDLDHFKKINDEYGHSVGNIVLKQVANLLKELTRKEDIVARYGGEEFTIVIPNSDSKDAKQIAERIRTSIENYNVKVNNSLKGNEEANIRVTASIGVASFPDLAADLQELIRYADRAMYIGSKQAGRNKVSEYEPNN